MPWLVAFDGVPAYRLTVKISTEPAPVLVLELELRCVDEEPLLALLAEALLEATVDPGVVLVLWLVEDVLRDVAPEEDALEMAEGPGWLRTNKAPAAEKTTSRPKTRGTAVLLESIRTLTRRRGQAIRRSGSPSLAT